MVSVDRMAVAKARLLDDLDGVLRALGIDGRKGARGLTARSPFRDEKNPSFTVWLNGPARGAWKDYGGGGAKSQGDIIDLVALLAADGTASGALRWAEDRYGLRRMSAEERRQLAEAQAVRRKDAARQLEEEDAAARERAIKLHKGAAELTGADPASIYLALRGCPLSDVPNLEPKTFRWVAAHPYWLAPRPYPVFPALLSEMRDGAGRFVAVHRTLLKADGSDKARVKKPKLMYPAVTGSTIRVSRGPSNLSCEDAAAQGVRGPMMLCEGVEDGATLAICAPEFRVHACASLSGVMNVPDFACADAYLVCRDNDWGKPQAADNFAAAMRRLHGFGKPVADFSSPQGKDFNDIVRTI